MLRRWLVTLLGIAFMIASVLGYSWYATQVDTAVEMVQTVQPNRWIASGEVITKSILRNVMIPRQALTSEAIRNMQDIVGQTAMVPIGPEEQIAAWKLTERRRTPLDKERYVSFNTDEVTNVGNMLRKGDLVDVWVEFKTPVRMGGEWIGAVKVIENLQLASVRTADGLEIHDELFSFTTLLPTAKQQELSRASASGKPAINVFIMSEEVYEAYLYAGTFGPIRLALPNMTLVQGQSARVTEQFRQYRLETQPLVELNGGAMQ
jgi:Flp pilus assembly protein CpaB